MRLSSIHLSIPHSLTMFAVCLKSRDRRFALMKLFRRVALKRVIPSGGLKARRRTTTASLVGDHTIRVYSSERWARDREHKQYGLTVKGFLSFLYDRKSYREVIRSAQTYQDLLTYSEEVQKNYSDNKGKFYMSSETRKIPLLPIKLQKVFRDRTDDKVYAECLTDCATNRIALQRDMLLSPSKRSLDIMKNRRFSERNQAKLERDIARSFTLDFMPEILEEILDRYADAAGIKPFFREEDKLPPIVDQDKKSMEKLREVHPDEYWFNYLKTLYEIQIAELKKREKELENTKSNVLAFFSSDP